MDARRATKAPAVVLVQYVDHGLHRAATQQTRRYPASQQEGFEKGGLEAGRGSLWCGNCIGGQPGAYSASPVAADGTIYFTSEDGEIFVVRAGPEYELLASNPVGEVLMATPAISEGVLFVRGLKHLFAIGAPAAGDFPEQRE